MKRKYMGIKKNKTFIDKMFLTAFTTYSFIEFSTVGANLFDAIIVTKYMGAEGIAALGLTYPFFSFAGIISGIFSTGMQISCITSLARGETLKTRKTFSMMVFISLVMSILFSGTVFCLYSRYLLCWGPEIVRVYY